MNKSSILQGTMTILAFLLCSLLFVFSEVANAHDCACAVELHDVEVAINDADFTNDRDRDNLKTKLLAVCNKISREKFYDAKLKLLAISAKAGFLSDPDGKKQKLNEDDAEEIMDEVDDAIACVEGL